MPKGIKRQERRFRRKVKVRARVFGTPQRPRLAVFRSLKHIYAQVINDEKGKTLVSASDLELKGRRGKKQEKALLVGELLAEKARKKKISQAVFDRAGYKYHGQIKALAEGARKGGLKF